MSVTFDATNTDQVASMANFGASAYRRVTMPMNDVATAAGSGAGASVTLAVVFKAPIPASVTSYNVHVTPNQDAVPFVTSKTNAGFTLTLNPRLAANTLAAGTNDIWVSWDQ